MGKPKLLLFTLALAFVLVITAVAQCTPGISVTIADVDPVIAGAADAATYVVSIESITTEDENLSLTVAGDPGLMFDWTVKELLLTMGTTETLGLEVTCPGSTAGDFAFTVSGEAWPMSMTYDDAVYLGIIETSSFTTYVHVLPQQVIPEVPLGTIAAGSMMIVTLVAYILVPRFRERTRTHLRESCSSARNR